MKKGKLLHGEISHLIAEMAHADTILIGDAGMPVPKGVKLIDLALCNGQIPFLTVLDVVLSELEVQNAYIDVEMEEVSPSMKQNLTNLLKDYQFKLEEIPHEELKERSKECKAVIRTGEFTPYSNIILEAGVLF